MASAMNDPDDTDDAGEDPIVHRIGKTPDENTAQRWRDQREGFGGLTNLGEGGVNGVQEPGGDLGRTAVIPSNGLGKLCLSDGAKAQVPH